MTQDEAVKDLGYFDKLPKTVRKALCYALVSYSSEDTYKVYKKIGAKETIKVIGLMDFRYAHRT
jgi:hypothetical protein